MGSWPFCICTHSLHEWGIYVCVTQHIVLASVSPNLQQLRAPAPAAFARGMLIDGRLAALGAVAVGLTITWLRGRGQQRSGAAAARQCSRHSGVRLLPRGRPLPSKPDEVSLVSYNILCQRYANSRRLPHVFAQVRARSGCLGLVGLLAAAAAAWPKATPRSCPCAPSLGVTPWSGSCVSAAHISPPSCNVAHAFCTAMTPHHHHHNHHHSTTPPPQPPVQYLDPDYRWQRLQAELASFGADLVALQEVTIDRCVP